MDYTTNMFDEDLNFAAPLEFGEQEIGKFTRDYQCICGSHLIGKHAPERRYYAWCPACETLIHPGGFITTGQADAAQQNVLLGMRELRPDEPRRPDDDILKELGF